MISFDNALAVAENKRSNWGVPESMKSRFKVDIADLKDKTIEIESICVVSKKAKDKTGLEVVNKKGENVYNHITFIAFGGDKYTVTKSALMAIQLDEIEPCMKETETETYIPGLEGAKVKVGFKSVQYADKKMYDQPYLADA